MIEKIRSELRIKEAAHRQLKKELKKSHRESSRKSNGGNYYFVMLHLQRSEIQSKKVIRNYYLMLAFLEGKRYQEVEFDAKSLPNWFAVRDLLKEYLHEFRDPSDFEKNSIDSPSLARVFDNKKARRKIANDNFTAWVDDALRHIEMRRDEDK
jgi:hypothetical protein